MTRLIHWLSETFLHNPNQFASGGILVMAMGSVLVMLKQLPGQLWGKFLLQTTVSLTVVDDAVEEFTELRKWIETQSVMGRARHLDAAGGRSNRILNPTPGYYQYLWYHGRVIRLLITRSEKKDGPDSYYASTVKRSESIRMTTFGRNPKIFRTLMEDARLAAERKPKPELFVSKIDGWDQIWRFKPRPMDSVILADGVKERIVADVAKFRESEDWYINHGIPYHRGYLLEGPPGTGKSSLALGLASHFNASIYFLKLSSMTDESLRSAVLDANANSIIVMEDIDALKVTETRQAPPEPGGAEKLFGVTLSGLLNVLDGILTPHGSMFLMTTNHVEKLDPALIRPGRVDLQLHIGTATHQQKKILYNRIIGPGALPAEYEKEMSMAELQQALMLVR